MAEKPKSLVVQLRQLADSVGQGLGNYPDWFRQECVGNSDASAAIKRIYIDAADELERMQQLNGRLYKTLYPD